MTILLKKESFYKKNSDYIRKFRYICNHIYALFGIVKKNFAMV